MIPISVDELTEFLYSVLMRKSTNGDSMPEARRIARLMLASEQMYESLNKLIIAQIDAKMAEAGRVGISATLPELRERFPQCFAEIDNATSALSAAEGRK